MRTIKIVSKYRGPVDGGVTWMTCIVHLPYFNCNTTWSTPCVSFWCLTGLLVSVYVGDKYFVVWNKDVHRHYATSFSRIYDTVRAFLLDNHSLVCFRKIRYQLIAEESRFLELRLSWQLCECIACLRGSIVRDHAVNVLLKLLLVKNIHLIAHEKPSDDLTVVIVSQSTDRSPSGDSHERPGLVQRRIREGGIPYQAAVWRTTPLADAAAIDAHQRVGDFCREWQIHEWLAVTTQSQSHVSKNNPRYRCR